MNDALHWDTVYRTKGVDEVSWYQASANTSLALVRRLAPELDAPVLDVGGGASVLVDGLLSAGYRDLTVLDISGSALDHARRRLRGSAGPGRVDGHVHWIEADVREAVLPEGHYAVWHDRAAFHFLTDPGDRAGYMGRLRASLRPGGAVVIATFAPDGPTSCSGLPVMRHSPGSLHAELGGEFELVAAERELHLTPTGAQQAFVYCAFRRNAAAA